jgi:asparagine synthase (glutamine-hydrolysing)
MCGIVGFFSFRQQPRPDIVSKLGYAVQAMKHRGPDGQHQWNNQVQNVGFAHARLSVIDLSTVANQPMHDPLTGNVIVFNGEIYNHAELRRELTTLTGCPWTTDHSDTEVILRAYQVWGRDCIQRFIGMFAFAIYDAQKESLWMVRDRLGIKPLYFARGRDCVVFASELTCLLRLGEIPLQCNQQAVLDYLSLLSVPAPNTLVQGANKLAAGHWMEFTRDGDQSSHSYWNMLHLKGDTGLNVGAKVRELLQDAVRLRLEADVPVGVFLSGGIDSTLNLGLFSQICPGSVHSFCIGFDQQYQSSKNEFSYARIAAQRQGAKHHELVVSEADCLQAISKVCENFDEPIGDPSCLPTWLVSKFARDEGMTVCQVGEGSDEIFFGYSSWRWKYWLSRMSRWMPGFATGVARKLLPDSDLLTELNYPERQSRYGQSFWGSVDVLNPELKSQICSGVPGHEPNYSQWPIIEQHWKQFQATCSQPSITKWFSYLDLKLRVPELLLMRVDKMSMAHSLECRVPFLDHRLVEYAMSLPESVRCPGLRLKGILKDEFKDFLPDELINRPKQGFWFPLDDWLDSKLGDEIWDTVSRFQRATGILSAKGIETLWKRRTHSKRLIRKRLGMAMWSLFVLSKSWDNLEKNSRLQS